MCFGNIVIFQFKVHTVWSVNDVQPCVGPPETRLGGFSAEYTSSFGILCQKSTTADFWQVSDWASLTDHTVYSFLELKNNDVAIFEGYWDIKHNFILVILKKRKHKVQKYSAFGRGLFKVSLLGVDSLWGDCTFIPADWGS